MGGRGGPLLSLTQKKPALLKCHQGKKFLPKSMGWAGGGREGGLNSCLQNRPPKFHFMVGAELRVTCCHFDPSNPPLIRASRALKSPVAVTDPDNVMHSRSPSHPPRIRAKDVSTQGSNQFKASRKRAKLSSLLLRVNRVSLTSWVLSISRKRAIYISVDAV